MEEEFVRNSLPDIRCGRCGNLCLPGNIKLLEHQGVLWYFSVYCHSCGSEGFVLAIVNNGEMPETDAELLEGKIVRSSTPVYSDDVLDMYTFLKDSEGDFSSLFNDE